MHYIQGYFKGKGGVGKRGKYEKSCALPVVKNICIRYRSRREHYSKMWLKRFPKKNIIIYNNNWTLVGNMEDDAGDFLSIFSSLAGE